MIELTNVTGNLVISNTDASSDIIMKIGASGVDDTRFRFRDSVDTEIFQISDIGVISHSRNAKFNFGTSDQAWFQFDGADTEFVADTGNLTLENTSATKDITMKLGFNTANESFKVTDHLGSSRFDVDATGDIFIPTDGGILNFGVDNDLQITHSGTAGSITNTTGSLTIKNNVDEITIESGRYVTNFDPGFDINIISGIGGPQGTTSGGGDINLTAGKNGNSPGNEPSGSVNLTSGFSLAAASSSGAVNLVTGDSHSTSGTSGSVTVTTGTKGSSSGVRGDFTTDTANVIMKLGDAAGASNFVVQDSAAAEQFKVDTGGTVTITDLGTGDVQSTSGVLSATSDERLKDIHGLVEYGLDEVLQINPIIYNFKWETALTEQEQEETPELVKTPDHLIGFRAQNICELIPEACHTNSAGFMTLTSNGILAACVNAIKELKAEINLLKAN
jgi:hypothetical protein